MAGYHAEYAFRSIFKRCVSCPDEQPTCPSCPSDQVCIQKLGDCNNCPEAVCVPSSQAGMTQTTTQSSGGKTNVGAIAGGVIGGVAFIAIITFILWRFCIRPRYNYPEEDYSSDEYASCEEHEKSPKDFAPTEQARNSTHSVRSVASTVMTRASNVIQIAFIPGITDRQGHDDSVPPVPAIPSHQRTRTGSTTAPSARGHTGTPDHFFTPADLGTNSRWSQFSNTTTDSEDIRSTRHQSLASSLARESVASTIFQDHHATPMSAAQGVRGKASVVSVKPSTVNTPNSANHIPEVPAVDYFKYAEHKKKDSDTDVPHAGASKPTIEISDSGNASASGTDAPLNSKDGSADKKPSSKMLAAAIQEATRRASRQPTHGGLGSVSAKGGSSQLAKPEGGLRERDPSPFSDSNAVHTP